MKVAMFYADMHGNGYYRMHWPAETINRLDLADVEVLGSLPNRLQCHVAVFQRVLRKPVLDVMHQLQDAGCAIVVEHDDDMLHFPPGHPLRGHLHSGMHPTKECTAVLTQACEMADLVTVPTQALAGVYAPHGRYEIIPNCIPAARLAAGLEHRVGPSKLDTPTVGYRGAVDYHGDDLEEVGRGVQAAQQQAGFDFLGLGSLNITNRMHVTGANIPWADMHDLTATGYVGWLSRIDIGLVPLRRCAFNEGKSDLAALEYAALGVPTIASPTQPYLDLEAQGLCTIARTPHQWRDHILDHVNNRGQRNDLIDYAATRTFELNAWRWVDAWAKARANRG